MTNSGKKIWLIGNDTVISQQTLSNLTKLLEKENFIFDDLEPELVISVGGDGTFLRAFHMYEHLIGKARFVGVHTGHLGFYTDFAADDLTHVVETLKNENPVEAIRYPLLSISVKFDNGFVKTYQAVNEMTLRRTYKTLVTDIKISDFLLEKFRGDGISISTPTGSTAYNKSIGGAVMDPKIPAMQLSEIASLNNIVFRTLGAPLIVSKEDSITLCPDFAEDYVLTVDHQSLEIKNIQEIQCQIDTQEIAFVGSVHQHFWPRVRASFIGEDQD